MSDKLKRWQDRTAAIAEALRAIDARLESEDRIQPSDSEKTDMEALHAEAGDVNAAIEREQRLRDLEAMNAKPVRHPVDEPDGHDKARAGDDRPKFESLGQMLVAAASAAQGGVRDRRLQIGAVTPNIEGVASAGGFLVQPDHDAALMRRVHDTGQVWNMADDTPVSGNGLSIDAVNETSRADGSRAGGVQMYWDGEGGTKTPSGPEFAQIKLDLKKLIGLAKVSDELLQDSTALESVISSAFVEEAGFKFDDAAINGTGAGQPLGLLASVATVSQAKQNGQLGATILSENVEKMYSRLWARSIPSAVWFINQSCWPQIFQLSHDTGTAGTPMFMRPGTLPDSPNGSLLGRPIFPIEQCAALGTVGDIILADMSQYKTISKGGIQSASSIHVYFTTDYTAFRWVVRVDGQPKWNAPLTPYKDTGKTQSPFITLATRA